MRTLVLVPFLAGLSFGAVVELGHPANGNVGAAGGGGGALMAALEDPLALFDTRSPGGRGAGALLSTKPGLAAAGPEERVLADVRQRDPGIAPGTDPVFGIGPDAITPSGSPPLDDPGIGGPPSGGSPSDPSSGDPFGAPSSAPFSSGPGESLIQPYSAGAPPGDPGIPAVPEPATWAMLIIGFFAVGAVLRRRARDKADAACVP